MERREGRYCFGHGFDDTQHTNCKFNRPFLLVIILTAKEMHSNTITALLAARAANTQQLIHNIA